MTPGVYAGKQAMQIEPAKSLQLIGAVSLIGFTEVAFMAQVISSSLCPRQASY
jgi:hypothetical protein